MSELLLYAPFLLVPLAIQLVILFATQRRFRPLRFAEPVLVGAAGMICFLLCCLTAPPGWALLLFPLAVIVCLALASLALLGWALAWLIYRLVTRKGGRP